MPYLLLDKDAEPPEGYTPLKSTAPIPGQDWLFNGQRFRETARTPSENGYKITLERADIEPLYSYITDAPRES